MCDSVLLCLYFLLRIWIIGAIRNHFAVNLWCCYGPLHLVQLVSPIQVDNLHFVFYYWLRYRSICVRISWFNLFLIYGILLVLRTNHNRNSCCVLLQIFINSWHNQNLWVRYISLNFTSLFGYNSGIPLKELLFIGYAGMIRGAVAFGLVLRIDKEVENRPVIVTTALTLVILTTVFMGSTVSTLAKVFFNL